MVKLKELLNITEGKSDRAFTKIINLLRKESRKLNDDDSYELSTKLKQWFIKNVLQEIKMPNRAAKARKQERRKKNDLLNKFGRTKKQIARIKKRK